MNGHLSDASSGAAAETGTGIAESIMSLLPKINIPISERKVLLGMGDLTIINLSLAFALSLRPGYEPSVSAMWTQLPWYLMLSGVFILFGFLLDIYNIYRSNRLFPPLAATLLACILYLFIPFITPDFPQRRLEAFLMPALATAFIGVWRFLFSWAFSQPIFQHRAIIIGAGWSGRTLVQAMNNPEENIQADSHTSGYRLLGYVDADKSLHGQTLEGIPVLGSPKDLMSYIHKLGPTELIIAISNEDIRDDLFKAILQCREKGLSITTMTKLYEDITGKVPLKHAGRNLHVVLPLGQPATHHFYLTASRLLDICVSLVVCTGLALMIPFIWIANRLFSPGPLFYRQVRVGKNGKSFKITKFRSMVVDAEKGTGAVWSNTSDARVTPFGRFLRATHLDELPQAWNVLVGEMSLVGPRPERPEFMDKLNEIPFYNIRHAVKPGITGWAQVRFRYGSSMDDSLVKLQYDLFYIKNRSFLMDLFIILKTLETVPIELGIKKAD